MTYHRPVVLNPYQAQHIRRSLRGTGLGFLGANSSEALRIEVGPPTSRLTAVASGVYARGPVLDMAVTPRGVTRQEAGQLPDRIRAALRDCGHYVEEAKWGGGSGLEALAGKVYVRWRAASRVNAVQHMNEIAAILASAAPAFGPDARLTTQRMRVNPGPLASDVYVYLEPSVGLPQVVCDAARSTPIPSQEQRTFTPSAPAPSAPDRSSPELPAGKQAGPGTGPQDEGLLTKAGRRQVRLATVGGLLGISAIAIVAGVGLISYYAYKKDKAARRRVAANRRRKRRRRRR